MPTTPLLGITELTANQSAKETTINNAILALEGAGNATLTVSMAGGNVTLSVAQFSGSFIFETTGLTAGRVLNIPATINVVNTSRVFAVRNTSAFSTTVQITGGAGANVIVPAGASYLLSANGAGDIVLVQSELTQLNFIDLQDAPVTYTGQALKVVRVNAGETAVEFFTLPAAGAFIALSDAPAAYTAKARQMVAVNAAETAVEFVQVAYRIGGFATASILTDEILLEHVVTDAITFAANFVDSKVSVGTNPTTNPWVADVRKNGSSIGSISITSAGVVTLTTTGGTAKTAAVGDIIAIVAPTSVDATIALLRYTLRGTI